jgi:hypothetical protein
MRALLGLTAAVVLRLLREGLVLRSLAWPGPLTAMTMFVVASIGAVLLSAPSIVVNDARIVAPLERSGFVVTVDPDAETRVRSGRAIRAIWFEDNRWVFGGVWGGRGDLQAESVLRDFTSDAWRIAMPPLPTGKRDVALHTGRLAGIIGVLFALYGVVVGAGALHRDRSAGALESDLALAVPRGMHAAARILALSVVLVPALVVSLLSIDAMTRIEHVETWIFAGSVAAVGGGLLGLTAMARAKSSEGFSNPLSRALTLTTSLLALGWTWPDIGRFFPLASVGSTLTGATPSPAMLLPLAIATFFAIRDFHRSDNL